MSPVDNFSSSNTPQGTGSADLVLVNGRIYTVDNDVPWAEAVAIKDGRFSAVGDSATVTKFADEHTTVVDLDGRFAMPGLYDMHTHPDLALGPRYSDYLDIGIDNPTPDQVEAAILAYADSHPGVAGFMARTSCVTRSAKQGWNRAGTGLMPSCQSDRSPFWIGCGEP